MIKKIALTAATVVTLSVLAAAPASADGEKECQPGAFGCSSSSQSIPEPASVLGMLTVGGGLIIKKVTDGRKAVNS